MDRKKSWVKRTKKSFITATHAIIEQEGFEKVTIRKVAELAGYKSSSLYNYFDNLDELLYMSSIKYTKGYLDRLIDRETPEDVVEQYIDNWRCFAEESLKQPAFYYRVFFTVYASELNTYLHEYYDLFTEDIQDAIIEYVPLLEGNNVYKRDIQCLKRCVDIGLIQESEVYQINEILMLLYQGILSRVLDGSLNDPNHEIVERFVSHIQKVLLKK